MHAHMSSKKQEARISALQAEVDQLQEALGPSEDSEKITAKHIKLLHKYNEAKDATQILIGRLAAVKQITVKQIHQDYELTNED